MKNMKRSIPAAIFVSFLAVAAASQDTTQQRRYIQATGESVVSAEPTRARIDIGVVTQASTSQAAADQNASRTQTVLTRLRAIVGQSGEIRTVGYSLTPNYTYPREGGEPKLTGYTATNIVRVTLDDLTKVGPAIDTATQAGANRVQSLQFMLKDERAALDDALRQASQNAMRKASSIASSLGVRIIRVLTATESGGPVVPIRDNTYVMRAESTQTPIEAGTIEVRASVTLTVEIG